MAESANILNDKLSDFDRFQQQYYEEVMETSNYLSRFEEKQRRGQNRVTNSGGHQNTPLSSRPIIKKPTFNLTLHQQMAQDQHQSSQQQATSSNNIDKLIDTVNQVMKQNMMFSVSKTCTAS